MNWETRIKLQIEFLFNKWKKYTVKEIIIDEASNISEKDWNKIKKIKAGNGSIIECHTSPSKIRGFTKFAQG